jgi:purine-binding chemotaxis protein CheW
MSDHFDKARDGDRNVQPAEESPRQFLSFTVGPEEYGVDIMSVREIKGWTETTRLPGTPDYMRGVMNLRGLIIPIFDLRMRFSIGLTEATPKHVVIILAVGERNIGVLVDAVSDILDAGADAIKPAPARDMEADLQCVRGLISHQDRMVVLLDVEKLFDIQRLNEPVQAA